MPFLRALPWVFLVVASCRTQPSSEQGAEKEKSGRRYHVERGVVEYVLDGMEKGTETVRFEDFGRREVKHKKFVIDLGIDLGPADTGPQEIISVLEGSTIVNYDPAKKSGTRTLNSLELLGGEEKFAGKNMADVSKEMYVSMGGRVVGNKTIAGLPCEVWKIEKLATEVCLHQGLSLEITTTLGGMKQHSVAVKVDWAAPIDAALFVVPKDVTLRETDLKKVKRLREASGRASASPSGVMSPEDALDLLRDNAPAR